MAIVETQYGRVEGTNQDSVLFFGNIPYAAPPVGELRWAAPQAPESWSEVRDGLNFGPVSWQVTPPPGGPLSFDSDAKPPVYDEDCLSLNVWTQSTEGSNRPVMVWIHGGGFTSGSGSSPIYNGRHLVQRGDVVVVTINYRLGALGFLNLNEITNGAIPATGNEGLLDQAFALRWVQDNIARFGGDPSNVTIFGESAGGMSVGALLALKEAKGLFHKAIPQSGAAHTANTLDQSHGIAQRFLDALEIDSADAANQLISCSPEQLIQAGVKVSGAGMVFQPCIDGNQLPARPIECISQGSADGIDVLVGSTRDEWLLFSAMDPNAANFTEETLQVRLSGGNGQSDLNHLAASYKDLLQDGRNSSPSQIYAAIETDRAFRMPGIKLAETVSERGGSVFQYLFTVESPAFNGMLKSCHAIDIGYVFGTLNANQGTQGFFGGSEANLQLSEVVMDAWLTFAKTGNPATQALSDWKRYDKESRSTAVFGIPPQVESAPFEETRSLWEADDSDGSVGIF